MKKIVSFFGEESQVFKDLNNRADEYARAHGFEYKWVTQNPYIKKNVVEELQKADAGIIDIETYDGEIFEQIKNSTKLLIRFGVGFDQVDLKAASNYGIAIARTTAANTTAVAEMALMLMLNARRKFPAYEACVKAGEWTKEVGHEVIGSTVGIVGFGVIGQRLAQLLSGFGCKIMVYDPQPKEEALQRFGAEAASLEEVMSKADAISIHTPYNSETHNMIDSEKLALMKPEAVLVNTARGKLVDENALYKVLKKEKIAAAAFDVFATEPLPLDSPLRQLHNMIITPHVSSQTVESLWNIYKVAIDIAVDFFAGKDSRHILNPDYKDNK